MKGGIVMLGNFIMTKRIMSALMTICIAVSSSSCSSTDNNSENENYEPTLDSAQKNTLATEIKPEDSTAEAEYEKTEPENSEEETKTAVVYFSATGKTAEIAEMIADKTNADLFEIVPEIPYVSDDLNYNDDNCRANKEMNDDSARPEISGDLSDVESYDTIYLGYPIWWGTAPRIIQTFIESCDLSDAEIYTFCTSGGSGIEKSVSDLQDMYQNINIMSGKRLNGASEEDVHACIEELN